MPKRIYTDTNIFVYHLFNPNRYPVATKYLKNIENGNDKGVTSVLTIMETYTSGRQILASHTSYSLDKIDTEVRNAIKFFYSMKNLEIIPNNNFDTSIANVLNDGFIYISKYKGKIKQGNKGRNYKGLYSPDAIHLSLAINSGCDEFLTADSDFDATKEKISVNNILAPSSSTQ